MNEFCNVWWCKLFRHAEDQSVTNTICDIKPPKMHFLSSTESQTAVDRFTRRIYTTIIIIQGMTQQWREEEKEKLVRNFCTLSSSSAEHTCTRKWFAKNACENSESWEKPRMLGWNAAVLSNGMTMMGMFGLSEISSESSKGTLKGTRTWDCLWVHHDLQNHPWRRRKRRSCEFFRESFPWLIQRWEEWNKYLRVYGWPVSSQWEIRSWEWAEFAVGCAFPFWERNFVFYISFSRREKLEKLDNVNKDFEGFLSLFQVVAKSSPFPRPRFNSHIFQTSFCLLVCLKRRKSEYGPYTRPDEGVNRTL